MSNCHTLSKSSENLYLKERRLLFGFDGVDGDYTIREGIILLLRFFL